MKVAVVGLGVAGLRAAMLLEQAGLRVELFEARSRVGGRLYTADEGGGAVYDAGGEWIDADHHRTLALLSELGMEPLPRGEWPRKVRFREKESTEALLWSDAMEDDIRVESAARELCRDLREPPWKNRHAADLDSRDLGSFLAEHTKSERGLWYVTAKYRSDEGDDPDRIGLLGWLAGYLHYMDRDGEDPAMSAFRFPGGAGAMCHRMLERLRSPVRLGAVLRRVSQNPLGVTLHFDTFQTRVDRVVLTLPPPALERVCFDPALTVTKRCAVEASRMSRAIKIAWEFSEAWWKEIGWGGSMLCDGPLQQTWDGSLGDAPVMCAYICGRRAEEWAGLGDPVNAGVYELAKLFPRAAETFQRGWAHNWIGDPYALGAFAHLPPNYVLEHMAHAPEPDGCIHFAGEYTALYTGFIEGAVESAERVAREVLAVEGAK